MSAEMCPTGIEEQSQCAAEDSAQLRPFLKWAGGKRQLLPEIRRYLPELDGSVRYFEPFIGGGAVLFDIKPSPAVINDSNPEIANAYRVVRDEPEALIHALAGHINEPDYYYHIRGLDRSPEYCEAGSVERASRLIFLNRTCYNGLYRVNRKGHFNVPFGRYKNPAILNEGLIRAVSRYLNTAGIEILNGDFTQAAADAASGDFVYLDPPYDPVSDTSSFTCYASGGFGKNDQIRLRKLCSGLDSAGVLFMQSNSDTPFIRELYSDYRIISVKARRNINSIAARRGRIGEVLILNY